MQPITAEWVAKAEGDWTTAHLAYRSRKTPDYDAACFHAQQCAEKHLKALIQEAGIPVPRTQDLVALLAIAVTMEPSWSWLDPDLRALGVYAVTVRYTSTFATRTDARDAIRISRIVRGLIREALGLPT
ncbi:MAG TPA: HEPN domain-containing protein [Armatimonadota bacterium]|nr:HEPN domain-containing protein [Armatimonadota bacterium]